MRKRGSYQGYVQEERIVINRYSSPAHIYFFMQAKWRAILKNIRTRGRLKHVVFLIADHFEPEGYDLKNLSGYFGDYKNLAARHRDSYGNHPKFTWFYRGRDKEVLRLLTGMMEEGLGEIELHVHHGSGTENAFIDSGGKLKALISARLDILRASQNPGRRRYGFIHGMWALDNSRRGEYCGVNNELEILEDTGCFADFTFPAWGPMQPAKIESIYYAVDDPDRPKSYNTGIDAGVGPEDPEGLLIFEGPERSSLEILLEKDRLDRRLIDSWIRAHIGVVGRDEWIFVKTNIHSLGLKHKEDIFREKKLDDLFRHLEEKFDDGKRYRLHYASAREAYNIVKAAEVGEKGDPEKYRDYDIPPYSDIKGSGEPDLRPAEKINVAFLVDDLNFLYGVTRNLLENIKWIDKARFNPFIYVLGGLKRLKEFKELNGAMIRSLEFNKFNPLSYMRIVRLLKTDNIKILHSYPFISNFIGPALARIAKVKKCITSVHSEASAKKRKLLMKFSFGLSDGIIVVSDYLRKVLIKERLSGNDKIKTIYNGVDLGLFNPEKAGHIDREAIGVSVKDVVVMTVAMFRREKGYEYLIRAVEKIVKSGSRVKFIFVGDGPSRERIELAAKEKGLSENILFMGYRDDVQELLGLCDIFLLPSLSEGFAVSLIEAMAMKKPVITTAVGGIPEIVKDQETGLLIRSADPDLISAAIDRLAKDEPLRQIMGARGRQAVEKRFDARDRAKELEGLYLVNIA